MVWWLLSFVVGRSWQVVSRKAWKKAAETFASECEFGVIAVGLMHDESWRTCGQTSFGRMALFDCFMFIIIDWNNCMLHTDGSIFGNGWKKRGEEWREAEEQCSAGRVASRRWQTGKAKGMHVHVSCALKLVIIPGSLLCFSRCKASNPTSMCFVFLSEYVWKN